MDKVDYYFQCKNVRLENRRTAFNTAVDKALHRQYAANIFLNEFRNEFNKEWKDFDYYPEYVEKRKLDKNYTETDFINEEIKKQSLNKKAIEILAHYFADQEFHDETVGWNPFTGESEIFENEFSFKWSNSIKEFDFIRIAIGFYYSDTLKNEPEDHSVFIRNFAKSLNYPLNESNLHSNISKLILSKPETNDRIFDKLSDGVERFIKTKSK